MSYRVIDMSSDPRRGQFEYFSHMDNPYAGVTVQVDITAFLADCRKKQRPFFLSMLYAAARAANDVPELRRRILRDQVIEYDWCVPSATVLCDDDSYAYCNLECRLPFAEYLPAAQAAMEKARETHSLDDGEEALNLLFFSCLPWLHYTSLTQPTPTPADTNPRITWGKFAEDNGRMLLPVTLLVNHALADGLHISRFYEALEKEMNAMIG